MEKLKIFAKTIEEEAMQQVRDMSRCEAYCENTIRIMPDCHAGKGCTVGTVIAVSDRVVPNTVGVDIGCGMLVVKLEEEHIDLQQLDQVINSRIPSGMNIHETPVRIFEELKELRCINVVDLNMANCSIGSLGGGNHFIEINRDKQGHNYLVIHSGSRNLGVRVCKYYQKMAVTSCKRNVFDSKALIAELKAQGREREIAAALAAAKKQQQEQAIPEELAYLKGPEAEDYLHDMNICQRYATINRRTIADIILDAMSLHESSSFHTIHNYIDTEHKILRKGAVSAMDGEMLIIPMNMRDGSLLCRGKGNPDWLFSAPHGAGRLMSRNKAKETLSMEDFQKSMKDVYTTSVCEETIDEAPMAYKPMQEIMECITPTVEVLEVIKPIYNYKAKDDVRQALLLWKMGAGNSAKRFNGENPIPEKREVATKESWSNHPMPEKNVVIPMNVRISREAMRIVKYGHIPEAMEDHWFMYCDESTIRYYRSWTGICVFIAKYIEEGDSFRIIELQASRNPEEYSNENISYDVALFMALLTEEYGGDAGKWWEMVMNS